MTNPDDPINMAVGENGTIWSYAGLTKREYFAAMALQGILAGNPSVGFSKADIDYGAQTSVILADALIKALNETP